MIEKYFKLNSEKYYNGEVLKDLRPKLNYQTGITPELVEKARNHIHVLNNLSDENKTLSKFPPN